jgi:hypothetical protein
MAVYLIIINKLYVVERQIKLLHVDEIYQAGSQKVCAYLTS